ncbi:MAG: hypothetical protein ABI620_04580 [Chloroflexota bacterium]
MSWAEIVAAAEDLRRATAVPGLRLAGIGWATVDLERARAELDGLLAGDPRAPALQLWAPLEGDLQLGARGSVRAPSEPGSSPALVALEPDTEGRLAAFLVRFGEGIAVIYLGEGLPRQGRLLPGGPAWGPHVVVLDSDERPLP